MPAKTKSVAKIIPKYAFIANYPCISVEEVVVVVVVLGNVAAVVVVVLGDVVADVVVVLGDVAAVVSVLLGDVAAVVVVVLLGDVAAVVVVLLGDVAAVVVVLLGDVAAIVVVLLGDVAAASLFDALEACCVDFVKSRSPLVVVALAKILLGMFCAAETVRVVSGVALVTDVD